MKSSESAGSRSWQSASLPGSEPESSAPLRRASSLALRAASRTRAASTHLATMRLRVGRVLLEVVAELLVDQRLDEALDLAVAELGLGLPFELRLGNLDRDDRGEPFADVVALSASSSFFSRPLRSA